MTFRTFFLAPVLAAMTAFVPAADAAELTVYSGGAVKTGLTGVVNDYAKTQQIAIDLRFMPMAPLMKKLDGGLLADVVVLAKERMDQAVLANIVDGKSVVPVGTVAMGVAVNQNAKAPDISTPEKFRAALLAAKSIVYIDPKIGTSGAHFAKVLEQLGITDEINRKATLGTGGYVVAPVGKGEIELGVHQITEILPVPGVKLVGPLPAPLNQETLYQGAVMTSSKSAKSAKALLAYLQSADARAIFKAKGFIEK